MLSDNDAFRVERAGQGGQTMKVVWRLPFILALALFAFGCDEEVERENPLDAQNGRTGGVPPGLAARANDSQVTLSWPNLGLEGVKEYIIYRAYLTPEEFEMVASVPAKPISELREYTYKDAGLQNDGDNIYFYRLTYVDQGEQETPDPKDPQSLPQHWSKDWFMAGVIPSEAPPVPDVQVLEDTDLQVRLIWEGYADDAPEDLAGFKVYSALKPEPDQRPQFALVAQIDDPTVEFYLDGNDYASNIINFRKDEIAKAYKVVAFDVVGVESDSPELEGKSANLPPNPPPNVRAAFDLGINRYEVRISWRESLEPDVIGYVVYALRPDNEQREFKKKIDDRNETAAVISDTYVVVGFMTQPKQYYVTAFDNTPKLGDDGKPRRDESEPSGILSANQTVLLNEGE